MHRLSKLLPLVSALVLGLGAACTAADPSAPKPDAPGATDAPQPAKPEPPGEQLPDGAELLAAHVEASGGVERIAKFETIHAQGTVEAKSHQLRGTMQLWWHKDGGVYLEQQIEGIGTSRFGYDGKTAWLDDPITGLRKLEGSEAASYLQSSQMFLGHDWQRHFSAAKTIGKAKLELGDATREVWEVELVSKAGPNVTLGIDPDTKLIVSTQATLTTLMGDMPVKIVSDRYEAVEGYQFSMHKVNTVSGLLSLDETITKFEVNVAVDPTMFAFPSKREVVNADPTQQPPIVAPAP